MSHAAEVVCWVNGQLQPQPEISAFERAFQFGDGLFETIRIDNGSLTLFDFHWQRLQSGSSRLGINLPESLSVHLEQFLISLGRVTGRLKIIISRGESFGGYRASESIASGYVFYFSACAENEQAHQQNGVQVFQCQHPLSVNPVLAGIKHLNRLDQVLAINEWQGKDFQEGLLCDGLGHIIEGCFSNIFWVEQGQLLTPSLELCGVDGVMRRFLMAAFSSQQTVRVETLSIERLKQADECFLCNSVYGVWPIIGYQQTSWRLASEPEGLTAQAIQRANEVLGIHA